tara:strand:+ start:2130 stop:2525 length:396 start_codon:yes stop_codon:yes gene_type:complete
MARVKVINGKPVVFNKLPEVWQGINGHYLNFDKMSEDIWLENEFFELKLPEYNPENQKLFNLHFNSGTNVYTYNVKDLEQISELDKEKNKKIASLRKNSKIDTISNSVFEKETNIRELDTIDKVKNFDITI